MATAETEMWEDARRYDCPNCGQDVEVDADDRCLKCKRETDDVEVGGHVLVTYRVRVCLRCKHAACPGCNGIWCDCCFDWDRRDPDAVECETKTHQKCVEEGRCEYEEPDSEACVEVRRELKTEAEYQAAVAPDAELVK